MTSYVQGNGGHKKTGTGYAVTRQSGCALETLVIQGSNFIRHCGFNLLYTNLREVTRTSQPNWWKPVGGCYPPTVFDLRQIDSAAAQFTMEGARYPAKLEQMTASREGITGQ